MVEVVFHGHSCFSVRSGQADILIDPFISGNPAAMVAIKDLYPQVILVSHGHDDHLGDAIAISRRTNALIVAPMELAAYCERQGAQTHGMQIGGSHKFDFGRVKLTFASHGSAVVGESIIYTGHPCGFLLTIDNKTIYHAGDTGLFGDMALIGKREKIDLALLPIGDNFGMGIDDAAYAVELLQPAKVVPMHYNTFASIRQDPEEFKQKVSHLAQCVIMKVEDKIIL